MPVRLLIVGAGPAGLVLALQAHDHGAEVRIVERRADAFRASRALIMHARTLEVLRPLGVTQALLAGADTAPVADVRLGSRISRVSLADLGWPDTAYPHLSLIRQMDVERVLAQALADRGIPVERGTELRRITDGPGGVRAVLRTGGAEADECFSFVAGCDGQASTVRAQAGIGWPGRPYAAEVVLADAELDGELGRDAAQVSVARAGLVFVFRLGEHATWRLLATRPAGPGRLPPGQPGPPVPVAELQRLLDEAHLNARVTSLAWSAQFRLQRRIAECFSRGRLYLVGDAAHAYSPATGQGMNAAIQDAANLGWKLAFAADEQASTELLGSYDAERRPVARRVLAMTHLAFWGEAAAGRFPAALRGRIAPAAAPFASALMRRRPLLSAGARVMSQLEVRYRGSPLSVEGSPVSRTGTRAGDRLPDRVVTSGGRQVRLHELLARPGVHVLLERDAPQPHGLSAVPLVSVHRLTSIPGRGVVAVRPDGHIGFRCRNTDTSQLSAWLARAGASRSGPAARHSQPLPRTPDWRA